MRGLTTILLLFAITQASHAPAIGQSPPPADAGNQFVAQVLIALEHHESIAAKLRYESRLHDQKLVGSGNYWQQRTQDQRVTRWEMQTQIADQTASFVQVYDGNHLWTDRRLPSGRQVHRLDVAWLQARLREEGRGGATEQREQLISAVEGQGGLGQMLADLLRNFDFQPPEPTQLNGLPVNALIGHWRPEQLTQLWPDAAKLGDEQPPEWPEQLPHHVLLLVGRNMFPYVCEHRRAADAPLATSLAGLRPTGDPLLRYEIFEVQFAVAIPPEKFQFLPGDIPWTDETAVVLGQLTQLRSTEQK
ncbi:MAG: hypothetical protein GXP24_11120 [Planctomycetes bacterium]|nr:hypothetical protein [Planctomycetota bacterium]